MGRMPIRPLPAPASPWAHAGVIRKFIVLQSEIEDRSLKRQCFCAPDYATSELPSGKRLRSRRWLLYLFTMDRARAAYRPLENRRYIRLPPNWCHMNAARIPENNAVRTRLTVTGSWSLPDEPWTIIRGDMKLTVLL